MSQYHSAERGGIASAAVPLAVNYTVRQFEQHAPAAWLFDWRPKHKTFWTSKPHCSASFFHQNMSRIERLWIMIDKELVKADENRKSSPSRKRHVAVPLSGAGRPFRSLLTILCDNLNSMLLPLDCLIEDQDAKLFEHRNPIALSLFFPKICLGLNVYGSWSTKNWLKWIKTENQVRQERDMSQFHSAERGGRSARCCPYCVTIWIACSCRLIVWLKTKTQNFLNIETPLLFLFSTRICLGLNVYGSWSTKNWLKWMKTENQVRQERNMSQFHSAERGGIASAAVPFAVVHTVWQFE